MASQRLAEVLLLGAVVAAMLASVGAPPPQPSSSCQRKCGDVEIPYPFGISSGSPDNCSIPGFSLTCNITSSGVYKPFHTHVEFDTISLQKAQARLFNHISSLCYDTTDKSILGNNWYLNLTHTPYSFSDTSNMFTVIGCQAPAYIQDDVSRNTGSYTNGCVAMCLGGNATHLTNGSCSGIGCCQAAIPKGMQYYSVRFDENFNTSDIYDVSPCNFAVLMDSSNFTFLTSYVTSRDFNKTGDGRAPLVVDWAIGNKTCEAARREPDTYACVSKNSECLDSPSGKGYICNCSKGFDGNPYLQDPALGCKDIDECDKNPCSVNAICKNTPGRFECTCPPRYPKGTPYNGTCERDLALAIGTIIGLSSGFGVLAVSVSGIFLARRWKRNIQKRMRRKYFRKNQGLLLEQLVLSDETASDKKRIFTLEELEKATNNFDSTRVLGRGGHGMVYKGILSDQRVVAIKRSKIIEEDEINQFINEVAILSQINHRNIVKLFGCCLETEVPLLVYEFIPNGSLYDILHADAGNELLLSWDRCLRIAAEAAGALCYLHSAASVSVFHRDVKSSNILLDSNYTAKVSDFGASRLVPIDQTHVVTNVQGTFGYLDPEYYYTGQLNEKSDVYSFGVLLLELLTRKKPILTSVSGAKQNLANYFLLEMKTRPITEIVAPLVLDEASKEEINCFASLAEMCLKLQGNQRPTMEQVEIALRFLKTRRLESSEPTIGKDEEMEALQTGTEIKSYELSAIDISMRSEISSSKNSQKFHSLEQEFMSTASLPR